MTTYLVAAAPRPTTLSMLEKTQTADNKLLLNRYSANTCNTFKITINSLTQSADNELLFSKYSINTYSS
jgi:hypothetical protein